MLTKGVPENLLSKRMVWLASNAAFLVLLLVAVILEVAWLSKVIITFVWLMLVAYGVACIAKANQKEGGNRYSPVPVWVSWAVDLVVVATMLWAGWHITAVTYIASCICLAHAYDGRQIISGS